MNLFEAVPKFQGHNIFSTTLLLNLSMFRFLSTYGINIKLGYSELAQTRVSAFDSKLYGRNDVFLLLLYILYFFVGHAKQLPVLSRMCEYCSKKLLRRHIGFLERIQFA